MRCLLPSCWSWMTVGVLTLVLAAPCWAAKVKDDKGHDHGPPGKERPKYVIVLHDEKGNELPPKTIDPTNPAHLEEVEEALAHGHLHRLEAEEPLDPFGIKGWDLGIWALV